MVVVIYYPDLVDHLALALTGLGEKNIYISFFPPENYTKEKFKLHTFSQDKKHEVKKMVILPTEESCGYGLSEDAIYNWWKEDFKKSNKSFGWVSTNCSSIVYEALCVGQLKSNSLKNILLKIKNWFCTPKKVVNYASDVGEILLQHYPAQNKLLLKYHEIKACCELGKLSHAYTQAMAISIRLKQLAASKYSIRLNNIFCDGIKQVLFSLRKHFLAEIKNSPALVSLFNLSDLKTLDIDSHFKKLQHLADFIYSQTNNEAIVNLQQALQASIKLNLLTNVNTYLDKTKLSTLTEKETISLAIKFLEKINDKGNPNYKYVAKQEDISHRHFGYGLARFN